MSVSIKCNQCGAAGGCDHVGEPDTPPLVDVLGEQPPPTIPVEPQGITLVDQIPRRLAVCKNVVLVTGARAVRILNADKRRHQVILWAAALGAGCEAICIAASQIEVDSFTGAMIFTTGTVPVRYELDVGDELWARGCVINDSTGTFSSFGISTDDAVLSVISTQWAR